MTSTVILHCKEKVENIKTWSGAILNHEIVILRPFLTAERHLGLGRGCVAAQRAGFVAPQLFWRFKWIVFYESLFESVPSVRQVTALIAGSVIIRFDCEWTNECMNEWVNEWMKEWMDEWVNEWVSEWHRQRGKWEETLFLQLQARHNFSPNGPKLMAQVFEKKKKNVQR